ncbi:MAG: molybdenum cofactor biosynthesis protein MoaE [Candidatus Hydrothermarchaeales archaeon]
MDMIRIQEEDFSIQEEINRVKGSSKRIGGIVSFLGTVRDFSRGKEVSKLVYEQYSGMALKKLEELRNEALEKFNAIEVSIIHRYGTLEVGENVVLVIAAAEHRIDAFETCRWCIDELKKRVPIWKKEFTSDGGIWIEEHP